MRYIGEGLFAIDVTKRRRTDMRQEEHINTLINQARSVDEVSSRIQKAYEEYMTSGADTSFNELLNLIDARCIHNVRKLLWINGLYNDENENEIIQNARISVWEYLKKNSGDAQISGSFEAYVYGIYNNKALDVVRKASRKRKKFGDITSLDEMDAMENGTIGDHIADANSDPLSMRATDEKRKLCESLFEIYVSSMMNSKAYPPRGLALYYARILPHLLHVNFSVETIPDSKATSAKWAFSRMENQTIAFLKNDSEQEIHAYVSPNLNWGELFVEQLEEYVFVDSRQVKLKNAIYTNLYGKDKIEDWADSMHKKVIKDAAKDIMSKSELRELAIDYISERDTLFSLVKGGSR